MARCCEALTAVGLVGVARQGSGGLIKKATHVGTGRHLAWPLPTSPAAQHHAAAPAVFPEASWTAGLDTGSGKAVRQLHWAR